MDTIVFLGDSITDAGRTTSDLHLGNGYVSMFAEEVSKHNSECKIINKGVDGNITEQVAASLQKDCLSQDPAYVSILVGINDVGLIVDADVSEQEKLYMLEDSIRAYHEMLFDLSRDTSAKVITLEPFIFPADGKYEEWIPWQRKMSKNIKKLARNYNAAFVDLQEPFEKEIEKSGHAAITTDCIHLTTHGHELLAGYVKEAFNL